MAHVYSDGPDEFSAAQISRLYSGANIVTIGTPGPDGTGKYYALDADPRTIPIPLPGASEYMVIFDWYAGGGRSETWFQLLTAGGTPIISLSGGTTLTYNSVNYGGLVAGTWQQLQVRLVVSPTVGVVHVRIDGTDFINLTGQNTGSTNIGKVAWYGNNSADRRLANIVVLDNTGSFANSLPSGRVKVYTLYPDGDGAYTDWTPNSGSNRYSRINEKPADDDTSYVSDITVGNKFSCTMGDLPTSGIAQVLGTLLTAIQEEDDAGGKTDKLLIRSGSTDQYSSSDIPTVTAYQSTTKDGVAAMVQNVDPATSAQWDVTGINAVECGAKITA